MCEDAPLWEVHLGFLVGPGGGGCAPECTLQPLDGFPVVQEVFLICICLPRPRQLGADPGQGSAEAEAKLIKELNN